MSEKRPRSPSPDKNDRKAPRADETGSQQTQKSSERTSSLQDGSSRQIARKQAHPSLIPSFLEPSITFSFPPDDVVKCIADVLFLHLTSSKIEIEAKFGLILNPEGKRIAFPFRNSCVLMDGLDMFRFVSTMAPTQHLYFNKFFNGLTDRSNQSDFEGSKIRYKHTLEVDEFYVFKNERIRVTKSQDTDQVLCTIKKKNLAHINIHLPMYALDCRISVNTEEPGAVPHPKPQPNLKRFKDRRSYVHEMWRIDLTEVTQTDGSNEKHLNELEMEVRDVAFMMKEREKASRGEKSSFLGLCQIFWNNIRVIAAHAPPPHAK